MKAPWIIENANLQNIPSPLMAVKKPASGPSSLLTQIAGYWKLDEVSGTRFDSTANALDMLELVGPVASGAGLIGLAASFQGLANNNDLGADDSAGLFNPYGDFTINTWVKTVSYHLGGEDEFFTLTDETQSLSLMISLRQQLSTIILDTDNATSEAQYLFLPPVGSWFMLTAIVSYTNSLQTIFYNGAQVAQSAFNGMAAYTPGLLRIGGSNGDFGVPNGLIDETGVWNRALTPTEISTLYNGGAGITYPFS